MKLRPRILRGDDMQRGRTPNVGLGRLRSDDERDQNFQLKPFLQRQRLVKENHKYWWDEGAWLDQGSTPRCVAYAWTHWLADGPVTQKNLSLNDQFATKLYYECQKVDEWPGENYDGTSVRAGAKILQDRGLIKEYRWGSTLEELLMAIQNEGPVVIGSMWLEGMFFPHDGIIRAFGTSYGGHAYLANGFNRSKEVIRIKNSWGRNWGEGGQAWIPFEDLEFLFYNGAEICFALEEHFEKDTSEIEGNES